MKLTQENFARAKAFVASKARPLDQALFAFQFEGGTQNDVLKALGTYQNEDGGFGNYLEPDFRLQASSVMATTVAFHYMKAVKASADHPLVARGVAYLLDKLNKETLSWEPVPVEIDAVPRAPWWTHAIWAGRSEAQWANPNADCLSILLRYRDLVPEKTLEALVAHAHSALARMERPCEMHDFLCWAHLAGEVDPDFSHEILKNLAQEVPHLVGTTPKQWQEYSLRPYWVVSSPDDPLYGELTGALKTNLDFEIETQGKDGSWAPFWAWGQFEETWQAARQDWAGHITVKLLSVLKAFNRIEGGL